MMDLFAVMTASSLFLKNLQTVTTYSLGMVFHSQDLDRFRAVILLWCLRQAFLRRSTMHEVCLFISGRRHDKSLLTVIDFVTKGDKLLPDNIPVGFDYEQYTNFKLRRYVYSNNNNNTYTIQNT